MPRPSRRASFLPIDRSDLRARGWSQLDVLIVSGDAYVDHPAFGPALIGRWLESLGLRVGIVAQPRWDTPDDVLRMGRPRLFVGVSAGNLDSMLSKLTAQKKVRSSDDYSPGGRANARPNRATVVYANLCRQAFPGLPVVLGGIEASLRRFAHYDYWSDSVRRSALLDAKANLLVFGMAEGPIAEVATQLREGRGLESLRTIRGTAHVRTSRSASDHALPAEPSFVELPSYDDIIATPSLLARMTRLIELESNPWNARPLAQRHGSEVVWANPPALPLDQAAMDSIYGLPFAYAPHPSYEQPIPAFETVRRSIVTHRGCFGGCSFCSITQHEGRIVQNRSRESVLRDVARVAHDSAGVISDLGGPTANMYRMRCRSRDLERVCRKSSCVYPAICPHLDTTHQPLMELMSAARAAPGVRHVYVASGIRYDLALGAPAYIRALAEHHTGGQLSVAPEHVDDAILARMRKPRIDFFERFADSFLRASREANRDQYLVPYLIVGHPGSTLADTIRLALYLKRHRMKPRQVQEFIPTPMTVATAMYFTGLEPSTGKPVAVTRDLREKRMMKALVMWWDEAQWPLAREALRLAGRRDLIGNTDSCLVPSERSRGREGELKRSTHSPRRK